MLYNIELLPKAAAEFSEATEWYEKSKPNLGEIFSESVNIDFPLYSNILNDTVK